MMLRINATAPDFMAETTQGVINFHDWIGAYPMTTGRNFDEILRVLDSMRMTAKHKVATPVSWKQGEDVIIAGSVSDEDAKTLFPQGWQAHKPYLRIVTQPS